MKRCPFCAEEIQEEAVVCRFCRFDLKTGKPIALVVNKRTSDETGPPRETADVHKAKAKAMQRIVALQLVGIMVMIIAIPACAFGGTSWGGGTFFAGLITTLVGASLNKNGDGVK